MDKIWVAGKRSQSKDAVGSGGECPLEGGGERPDQVVPGVVTLDSCQDLSPVG